MSVDIIYSHDDEVSARWTGEGRPLTAQEVNGDLYNLKTAVEDLQDSYTATISIAGVSQPTASVMRVTLTDANYFDVDLLSATFRDRGAWAVDTPYLVNDTFTANGALYRVLFDHTSDPTSFDPNANDGAGHDYYAAMLSLPENSLPAGGAENMVVEKASSADFAYRLGYKLPTGGAARQFLLKQSSANQDADWDDATASDIAFSPSTGSALVSTNVADALEELEGLVGSGGGGGSISGASDVSFATGDPQFGAVLFSDTVNWLPTAEPAFGDVLKWDGSVWAPTELSFDNLSGAPTVSQLRSAPDFTNLGTVSGTVAIDPAADLAFKITPNGDVTLNASSTPTAGEFTLILYQLSTTNHTITFGTSFKTTGTLSLGVTSGKAFVMKFFCDGASIYELSRTGAL